MVNVRTRGADQNEHGLTPEVRRRLETSRVTFEP
jgi:hypothetical protein